MPTQSKSALELFVKSFIRTHKRASVRTVIVQAAIDLVDLKKTKMEGTQLRLPIPYQNTLTNGVLFCLNTMSKTGNRGSLDRTKALLTDYKNS